MSKRTMVLFLLALLGGCTSVGVDQLMARYGASPRIEVGQCRVVHVTAGNVFTCVRADRQPILVQLSGIQVPGSDHPLSTAAKEALQSLIIGQNIRLVAASIDQDDPYKRTLATVYNKDQINVNQNLISEGYAAVDVGQQGDALHVSLQQVAKAKRLGLWGPQHLAATKKWQNSHGVKPEAVQVKASVYRLAAPVASAVVLAAPNKPKRVSQKQAEAPKKGVGFSCGSKKTCGQMNSCAEARFYLNQCGLRRLDRDNDGIPCESICGG